MPTVNFRDGLRISFALRAFDARAIDYLLNHSTGARFARALERGSETDRSCGASTIC